MKTILRRGGQLIGLLGVLLMALSVVTRIAGAYIVGGFQTGTFLLAGIAGVSVGCFLLLWAIVERERA